MPIVEGYSPGCSLHSQLGNDTWPTVPARLKAVAYICKRLLTPGFKKQQSQSNEICQAKISVFGMQLETQV